MAMIQNSAFGKGLGVANVSLVIAAIIDVSFISMVQDNPNDFAFVILVVVLPALAGWKLIRLSRAA
jgi:hypothetical protein